MIIGVPKEIKDQEFRVGMVPAGVRGLVAAGHQVLIEQGAGEGSGISDEEYRQAGAEILPEVAEVFGRAEMVVKVKEPLPVEYPFLREGLIVFTYLHLAPLPALTTELLRRKVTAIAYETVQFDDGYLPLLAPMSEVAGKMSIQAGAHYLEKENNGRGILLGGVAGVKKGRVLILGSGTVGMSAARVALGIGAEVTVVGRNHRQLARLAEVFNGQVSTLISNQHNIEQEMRTADLVIGAVLVPGGQAPKLISRDMLRVMKKGAVIVDVSIDQGGCAESSRATSYSDPVYEEEGIIHYCVANMPGGVPRTSTFALTGVTAPYVQELADKGLAPAIQDNLPLRRGVNVYQGRLVNSAVAAAQGRQCEEIALI
ncbi:MAG: alanine dehydrogenase [Proteobacteria bacterium]|nr:alanine dehydrogenase [Pseudomonadota bacterium]MBU1716925.1 alanine dehydrogenase [Pseudomonadota bacterium]